jgi:hypothetical protein
MSLIQDALKRQQEETESSRVPLKAAPARPPAAPSVPETMPVVQTPGPKASPSMLPRLELKVSPPMPLAPEPQAPPPTSGQPGKPGKSRLLIAGIIVFCLLIALGGGLLVIPLAKQPLGHLNLLLSRAPMVQRPVQASLPPALPPVAATLKPAAAPANAPAPWISPAAATAPAFADEGEDVAEDVALPGVKEQIKPGAVPVTATWPRRKLSTILGNAGADQEGARLKPVVWPRLKLSAVFSNLGSGQSGARLNNRLILLGDQIDGVTLVEIRRDSVVLKCGQETRSLKMGMTLN